MDYKINIKTSELLRVFNNALDLVSPLISGHQVRVSYITFKLGQAYGLSKENLDTLVKASLIHDIGATEIIEANEIIKPDFESTGRHEKVGAAYFENSIFKNSSVIVRHHHRKWDNGNGEFFEGNQLPVECQIIHLADRLETYINKEEYILFQTPKIINKIVENTNTLFMPEIVNAFLDISKNESFWLYIVADNVLDILFNEAVLEDLTLNIDELYDLTRWFSNIIDFRSRYTAVHSRGVSATAGALARAMNLGEEFAKILEIAGFLHDLGKLAVPNSILEKNGKLDDEEMAVIKCHTFHTYNILTRINNNDFKLIAEYAAFHHERLDGSGYPFHKNGTEINLGARIMTVADIFTAIAEDRPYRKAMSKEEIFTIFNRIGDDKHLDSSIVKVLLDNYEQISKQMQEIQISERNIYEEFWKNI